MIKNKNIKDKFQSLFAALLFWKKKKKKAVVVETDEIIREPKGFELEISDLKRKIDNFLLTRKVNSGTVIERDNYKLVKSADKLFRLEGREKSGREFSIIVATGNYLSQKDNKVVGLIDLSEVELNRIIQKNHSSLESLLAGCMEKLDDDSLLLFGKKDRSNWKDILDWEIFWQEQLLLKLKPNILALLIIGLDEDFKRFFMNRATMKQKKIVNDELFYLNQGAGSAELSPHTRNRSLFEIDSAKKEFYVLVEKLRMEISREKGTH